MSERAINPEGVTKLAKLVDDYIIEADTTITAVAEDIGMSRTTLSLYLRGLYESDPRNVEEKLTAYLERKTGIQANDAAEKTQVRKPVGTLKSKDALTVLNLCDQCQQLRQLGVVVGRSGFGKTYNLRGYAANNSRVAYIECSDTMGCRDLAEAIAGELHVTRNSANIYSLVQAIRYNLNAYKASLLIVDEADKLASRDTFKKMEMLRNIKDQSDAGLVIAGEERLSELLRQPELERMANRVDCYARLSGLTPEEAGEYVTSYGAEADEDALNELVSRAAGSRFGCFRLLDRTMNAVLRVLTGRGETRISGEVIREASRMMMLR